MVSFSILVRFSRATTAVLALVAVLLMSTAGVARADQPIVLDEDQTGFRCEYRAEGEPQIDVSISFDAVAETGSSDAQVLSPDGQVDIALGSTGRAGQRWSGLRAVSAAAVSRRTGHR